MADREKFSQHLSSPPMIIVYIVLLFNMAVLFDISFVRQIVAFLCLTFLPGFLILNLLSPGSMQSEKAVLFSVGISLFFNMIYGFFINQLKDYRPLDINTLLLYFDIFFAVCIILLFLTHRRNSVIRTKTKIKNGDQVTKLFLLILLFILMYTVVSKLFQNQTNDIMYSAISLFSLAFIFLFIGIYNSSIKTNFYPIFIYIISFILILSTSLSSSHIVGDDVYLEYSVYQETNKEKKWDPSLFSKMDINNYREVNFYSYYSMFSITILPTIYQSFLNINPEYIYKIVFQLLFSFFPVALYFFFNSIFSAIISAIGVIFVMIQSIFFVQMQTLNRQEIAFLFLAISLFVIFDRQHYRYKNLYLTIFLLGIIFSHYSTNYLTVILIVVSFSIWLILENVIFRKKNEISFIDIKALGVFIIVSILWSVFTVANLSLLLKTGYGVSDTATSVYLEFQNSSGNAYDRIISAIRLSNSRQSESVKEAVLGSSVNILTRIGFIIGSVSRLLLILGVINFYVKRRKDIQSQLLLSYQLTCIFLLALMIGLPYLSLSFNIERLYLFSLIFLAPMIVIGGYYVLDWINIAFCRLKINIAFSKKAVHALIIILIVLHYIFQSSVIYTLFGFQGSFSLNQYSSKITNDNEILASLWLVDHNPRFVIAYDDDASNKVALANIHKKYNKISYFYYKWWNGEMYNGQYAIATTNDLMENTNYIAALMPYNKVYDNSLSTIYEGYQST